MSTDKLWNPFEPQHLADPYPMYRKLQTLDPVHLSSRGEWVITRYADVKAVLKNTTVRVGNRKEWFAKGVTYFTNEEDDLRHIHAAIDSFVLFLNPPAHTRIRNFVNKTWTSREVADIVTQNIDYLLHQIKSNEFDLVKDFAQPLPILTISRILGIPYADYDYLKELGVKMIRSLDLYHNYRDLVQLSGAARDFVEYFTRQIKDKSAKPDEGLISKMIQANTDQQLTEAELISVCIFLFIAGEETTAGSISTGMLHLLHHPYHIEYLRQHRETLPAAVEELFRYDSPAQLLGRITTEDITVSGVTIPKDSSLILVVAAANRDPQVFDHPDELNFERPTNRHLTFGTGIHFCLGDWLGRLEVKMSIEALLKAYPNLRVAKQPLSWRKNVAVRSLEQLIITVS